MSLQLIKYGEKRTFPVPNSARGMGMGTLMVSEFYSHTIQGENFVGIPATFLRLTGCTLNCNFCDTVEVWNSGDEWTFEELFQKMEINNVIQRLSLGEHLVFTGGSPLRQQDNIVKFLHRFMERYGFRPYVEMENECVVMPFPDTVQVVDMWNNSPKLENSGMAKIIRYKPAIIQATARLNNSWFKFVIDNKEDWNEIQMDYLDTHYVRREQIVLMPMGSTEKEIKERREMVVDIAIQNVVRYTTREHIVLWGKKTGI